MMNDPASAFNANSPETITCRSRYNMAAHIGNTWEWVAGRHYDGTSLDNAIDGLWLSHLLKQSDGQNSTPTGFDLVRGTVPADNLAGVDLITARNGTIITIILLSGLPAAEAGMMGCVHGFRSVDLGHDPFVSLLAPLSHGSL